MNKIQSIICNYPYNPSNFYEDKIIQFCIANILEPIFEGTFYKHSYGGRPIRNVEYVYGYLTSLINTNTSRHILVHGKNDNLFDNVKDNLIIDKLFKYGIRDKRVLGIIKKMLKSNTLNNERIQDYFKNNFKYSTLETLIYNIFFTDFDICINNQWNDFKTQKTYARQHSRINALKTTNLKEGYLIRYLDEWILVTSSEEVAEKWKSTCQKILNNKLKTNSKIEIVNLENTKFNFLGITNWVLPGAKNKLTLRTAPEPNLLNEKMEKVYEELRNIRKSENDGKLIENIIKYNNIIKKINSDYIFTTQYSIILSKEDWKMKDSLQRTIHKTKLKRILAKNCNNLAGEKYKNSERKTLAFCSKNASIGFEILGIGKFQKPMIKAQWITPYTKEGRDKYKEITNTNWNKPTYNPWNNLDNVSSLVAKNSNKIYNLEYFVNRPIVYYRDKCKCKVCGKVLLNSEDINIHHKDKTLPIDKINETKNLITLCKDCHYEKHSKKRKVVDKTIKAPVSKSKIKPSKEILLEEIKTTPFTQLAKKYGVSDNAIRKWAKSYDIYEQRLIKLK